MKTAPSWASPSTKNMYLNYIVVYLVNCVKSDLSIVNLIFVENLGSNTQSEWCACECTLSILFINVTYEYNFKTW